MEYRGTPADLAIYTVSGRSVAPFAVWPSHEKEGSLTISGLPQGLFVFELKVGGRKFSGSFSVWQ
jgi:hypothetical protein